VVLVTEGCAEQPGAEHATHLVNFSVPRSAARKTMAVRRRSSWLSRIPSPVVPQAKIPSAPRSSRKRTIGQTLASSRASPPLASGVAAATIRGGRSGMAEG